MTAVTLSIYTQTAGECNHSCHDGTVQGNLEGGAYSLVFIVGFLVNAAAMYAFIAKRGLRSDTDVYMFNLVIADSALILFLPFRIYDAFFCLKMYRLCTFLISVHYINMYASILTTTAISVQRYLAIRFPLQARSWRKKKQAAIFVCLVIWGLLVCIAVGFTKTFKPNNLWMCYERCPCKPLPTTHIVLIMSLGYLSPLMIIVFCSSQIIFTLLKTDEMTVEMKSTVAIVTANMIVFIVCYTPFHVAILVKYLNHPDNTYQHQNDPYQTFLAVSESLAATNCCFDSISYYFLLKRFYTHTKRSGGTSATQDSSLEMAQNNN
ncbi:G-protein coupled receptor 35 [Scomber japonicus]|uniref:G-protein coupled receptor 35 n=1 Tax=Scomber japonicus TaxID=13676 RepID=UPI0023056779|nr:G-protein coupled receptor 35 [Scomber japonicus]